MPLQATSGAASYDAFGGGVAVVPNYIEDVFSTYLYTGNSSTQTITNGIDLSTKGGLVWIKLRNTANNHVLIDTVRPIDKVLDTSSTAAQSFNASALTSFNNNGFTLDATNATNGSGYTYASWTFQEQPKFFDVVTYTGNGVSGRQIAHNLGSTPGFVVVKNITSANSWFCWHRSVSNSGGFLETTDAFSPAYKYICNTVNDTVFSVDSSGASVNGSGNSYVAYLFAHNAGGFGLTGTDNVISCGAFTTTTSPDTITLGYEPQWVLIKSANSATNWYIFDNMRGIPTGGLDLGLKPNLSSAESADANFVDLTATGFISNIQAVFGDGINLIYIAIRRGPMKVPSTGSSVYNAIARTGTGAAATITGVGFAPDWWHCFRTSGGLDHPIVDRLRGSDKGLYSNLLQAEDSLGGNPTFSVTMDGVSLVTLTGGYFNGSGSPYINHFFKRSPSVFDICCYTGTGSATTQTHNLGAVPQLIIVKRRNTSGAWNCYSAFLANTDYVALSSANGSQTNTDRWDSTSPTSTVFTVGTSTTTNASGSTYVAYLFATASGVSKVGSYTGNGTTQTINCGFTGGARFVLIKRTDAAGDWYVWDSARGIVAGNDPYLLLNDTAAEVTNTDYIDTYSAGFEISSTAPAAINANGGTYIFLAIA
jgi:hypothetical protein